MAVEDFTLQGQDIAKPLRVPQISGLPLVERATSIFLQHVSRKITSIVTFKVIQALGTYRYFLTSEVVRKTKPDLWLLMRFLEERRTLKVFGIV